MSLVSKLRVQKYYYFCSFQNVLSAVVSNSCNYCHLVIFKRYLLAQIHVTPGSRSRSGHNRNVGSRAPVIQAIGLTSGQRAVIAEIQLDQQNINPFQNDTKITLGSKIFGEKSEAPAFLKSLKRQPHKEVFGLVKKEGQASRKNNVRVQQMEQVCVSRCCFVHILCPPL